VGTLPNHGNIEAVLAGGRFDSTPLLLLLLLLLV